MIFEDGTKEDVVRSMIQRANRGILKMSEFSTGGNRKYQKSCDTLYVPSQTSIALTRDLLPVINKNAWHCSISFTDRHIILPYNEIEAAEWLRLVFGKWLQLVTPLPGMTNPNIRHYILPCDGDFVDLRGS